MSFFLLMMVPFIILFFFNHPSADDFGLAVNTKLFGFMKAQLNYYYTWTGKYFSNAVLSLSPLYFNSITGYKIFSLLLMLLFFYFLYKVIEEIAGSDFDNRRALLLTLAIFFLYFYSMPSVAQSFYWLTASVVYQAGVLFVMIFVLSYLRWEKQGKGGTKIFYSILAVLTLVMSIGSSEMAMTISVIAAGLLLIREVLKNKKLSVLMIILLLIGAIACYIVVSAPGNKIREQMFPGNHQFFFSLSLSLSLFFKCLFSWMIMSPLIPVTILLYPVLYNISMSADKKISFNVNPVFSFLILFACIYGLLFIPVWSIGKTPYSRTQNIIYFVFLIGWFYSMITLIVFLVKKGKLKSTGLPVLANVIMLCLIMVFLVVKNNVRLAFTDVIRGTAAKYDSENNARYDFIHSNSNDSLEVEPIRTIPRSIFVSDVLPDGNDEFNKKYAEYFNKKFIVLKDSLKTLK